MSTKIMMLCENAGPGEGEWLAWPGGSGEFTVVADAWGGGSASLEYMGPGATPIVAGEDTTKDDNGGGIFTLGPGSIRINIDTATGVTAEVKGVGA